MLAEFLFGSPYRMIRLDMSEFHTPDSTSKILGSSEAAQPTEVGPSCWSGSSRSRWRFWNEFEKAHANVWDRSRQVFDDGRLTDQVGQVGDSATALTEI